MFYRLRALRSLLGRQRPHRGRERHRPRGVSRGASGRLKIRDLKHGHDGFPRVHAWPPVWMPCGRVSEGEFGAEDALWGPGVYRPTPMGPAVGPYRAGADTSGPSRQGNPGSRRIWRI